MFPRERVYRIVDGRDVASHSDREMPVWGDVFNSGGAGSPSQVKGRIDAIVRYLEGIQSARPGYVETAISRWRDVMAQIRHILCPVDFSDTSTRALDHALAFARWHHAKLAVLHIHQLSTPVCATSYVGPEFLQPIVLTDVERQQLLATLNEQARKQLIDALRTSVPATCAANELLLAGRPIARFCVWPANRLRISL